MKKVLLFILLLFPFNIFAYSNYIIPGGDTIGVDVKTDGIMIIGFYKVNGKFNKGTVELKVGDYITQIDSENVTSVDEMLSVIEKHISDGSVPVTFRREGQTYHTKLNLVYENDKYKTGLYVKDGIKGCGSLSFIIPDSGIYGALGHEIADVSTNDIVEIKTGDVYENKIIGIDKSSVGVAGAKISKTDYDTKLGSVLKNTKYGIFGIYEKDYDGSNAVPIGNPVIGSAELYTVIDGTNIEKFTVSIVNINETSDFKNLTIEINDKKLLDATGGVVQGMSGSPIIQNNKVVGILTHVIVDRPEMGYGILISKMLEQTENLTSE